MQLKTVVLAAVMAHVFAPSPAPAQSASTGAIGGVVKDTTGAVLPGVTVEASSPALIEKMRTAVSDGQGNYKIVDLRPGTYTVTFALTGFGTVKREGLELTTGVTLPINADLKVGSLEETVTVTGASPVVDVQNVRTQNVLKREVLDSVPIQKNLQSYAALTLGATVSSPQYQDVGGNRGEQAGVGGFTIHGNRNNDGRSLLDGMPYGPLIGEGASQNQSTFINQLIVQESALTIGGASGEATTGGVHINIVPKDGGNAFTGTIAVSGTSGRFQSDNLTSKLLGRGLTTAPAVKKIYDAGGAIGGPISQDKLWFFQANRWWGTQTTVPGFFFNATPHTFVYTPDRSRPMYFDVPHRDNSVRLTWQVSSKHKIGIHESNQSACNCFYTNIGQIAEPAATADLHFAPQFVTQVTWSYPRTNKLLFDAGNSSLYENQTNKPTVGVLPTDIPLQETTTGMLYNARATSVTGQTDYCDGCRNHQSNQRFSMSYVTGSHAFKVGLYVMEGRSATKPVENYIPGIGPVRYNLRNGLPLQIIQYTSPYLVKYRLMPDLGIYAQDQWTMRRVTINAGVRFDHNRQYAPAVSEPAIPEFALPVRNFPEVDNVPNYNDISPRGGVAYDVFGNGKTALKGSIGRYVLSQVAGLGLGNAAASRTLTSVTRSWTDADGDFFPDCNLGSQAANGECGVGNVAFGQAVPVSTNEPEIITGWSKRTYTWQDSITLQQELRPGLAMNIGYFNTWYGNFSVTANRAYKPADFSQFCVTVPTSATVAQVPSTIAGRQICGFTDANFSVAPDNFVQRAANFGQQSEHYQGFDAAVNWRMSNGGQLQGGVSSGQTVTDNCALVQNNPQITFASSRTDSAFCHITNPWKGQTQYKALVVWPLPWYGIQLSGTYQNLPGISLSATQTVSSAQVQNLGRNLLTGAATVTLLAPNTVFEDRLNQLDLRFTKLARMGRWKIRGNIDLYNVFNSSTILSENFSIGPSYGTPLSILGARMLRFGAQIDF